jgi:hypothetical protein
MQRALSAESVHPAVLLIESPPIRRGEAVGSHRIGSLRHFGRPMPTLSSDEELRKVNARLELCQLEAEPANSAHFLQQGVGVSQIELDRVKGPVGPLEHSVAFGVSRVGDRLEELGVARGPTDVIRRASIVPVKTYAEPQAEIRPRQLLNDDIVFPVVTEVIFKDETTLFSKSLEDRHPLLVDLILGIVVEAHPDAFVANREGVQVRVVPAHSGQQDRAEFGHTDAAGNQDSPPDHRTDISQLDVKAEHALAGRLRGVGSHTARLCEHWASVRKQGWDQNRGARWGHLGLTR